jgi:hypothetical protein
MILEMIQRTYRIIRHRSDTLTRTKRIINKTQDFTQKSAHLFGEIKQDGFHLDDITRCKEGGAQLLNEAEQIADDITTIGDKIKDNQYINQPPAT